MTALEIYKLLHKLLASRFPAFSDGMQTKEMTSSELDLEEMICGYCNDNHELLYKYQVLEDWQEYINK